MSKRIFIIGCLWYVAVGALAQDFSQQYANAKLFYEEKNYNLAMEAFKPLIVYDRDNQYSEYASFYYALSAYSLRYPQVAKDMLLQMKRLYPRWRQLDEVKYWLAKIHFEQGEYFQAMLNLNDISTPDLLEGIVQMKRFYLHEIDDVETLNMMLEEHPQDGEVGRALVSAMGRLPYSQRDQGRLDSLLAKFELSRDEWVMVQAPKTIFKDKYRVALLFPFLSSSLDPAPVTKVNQFVLDLYEGMKQAQDTLAKQGINLELLAYDTEHNVDTLRHLLSRQELLTADLIVGPVGPAGPILSRMNTLVQDFSETNQINMINPVSNTMSSLGENPFAFLYQPSPKTYGIRTAEFINAHVSNKNSVVIYGNTRRDSVAAYSYMQKAEELGIQVVASRMYTIESSRDIAKLLADPTEFDQLNKAIEFTMARDSIGSIYVASDEALIFSKAASSVLIRNDSTLLVGTERWLDENSVDYNQFERLGVVMAAPHFVSREDPDFQSFRKKYIRKNGVIPSAFARQGYEFGLFLGDVLNQYGVYFQTGLQDVPYLPGHLVPGYNFQEARDNQYIPFISFRRGELVRVDEQ